MDLEAELVTTFGLVFGDQPPLTLVRREVAYKR